MKIIAIENQIESFFFHLPCAASLGRSTSVTFAHGSSSGAEGSAHGTEDGRLGEGGAEHLYVVVRGRFYSWREFVRQEKRRVKTWRRERIEVINGNGTVPAAAIGWSFCPRCWPEEPNRCANGASMEC